jgi:hypothetical protein
MVHWQDMDPPKLDIRTILTTLNHHCVVYILVGSLGAISYGARLQTRDIDICIATCSNNLQRTAAALHTLKAHLIREPSRGMGSVDMRDWTTLRLDDPTEHHLFWTPHGEVDILPEPLGSGGWGTATNYEQLSPRAVMKHAFGLSVRVAAFDEIVASKLATARPQDLAASAELRSVGKLLARGQQPDYGLEQFAADV